MSRETIHQASALDTLDRWDRPGPRYTSYPTALAFHEGFKEADFDRLLVASRRKDQPASIYVHLPYCARLCFFCGCHRIITRDRGKIDRYLDQLLVEIDLQAARHGRRRVDQLHWGGGSPSHLDASQRRRLMQALRRAFEFEADAEISIEVDVRNLSPGDVTDLADLGFNRMSVGVQDLDPRVQEAINRIQPDSMLVDALGEARAAGFEGVSFDLVYGLPWQTPEGFAHTVSRVIDFNPDRVSVFAYAHLPSQFRGQRAIPAETLPGKTERRTIFAAARRLLLDAGYVAIGMDHFARHDDPLAQAARDGTLHRNFQGYTTRPDRDLIGLGVTAIGSLEDCYVQNARDLGSWSAALAAGRLPIERGVELDAEDRLRRAAISETMCRMGMDFDDFGRRHGIDVRTHFADGLGELEAMAEDGIVRLDDSGFRVSDEGRLVLKIIAGVFDGRRGPRAG